MIVDGRTNAGFVQATLEPCELKLYLADMLEAREREVASYGQALNGQRDGAIAGIALVLFGENGVHIADADHVRLRNEAYAEWRRG